MTYIRKRGRVTGPHDEDLLRSMVQRGQLTLLDEASEDGTNWEPADSFPWFQPGNRIVSSGTKDEGAEDIDSEEHLAEQPDEDELAIDQEAVDGQQEAAAPAAPLELAGLEQPEEEPVKGLAGFSLASVASGSEAGTASTGASPDDDLQIAEEQDLLVSSRENFQPYSSPATETADEEFELVDSVDLNVGGGSLPRRRNMALIVLGYIAGFLSLFVLPVMLGFVGVVCGMINFSQEEHVHGAAQIAIAIVCTILGLVLFA